MSGTESLCISKSSLGCAVESSRIHSMPCSADHDGEANISSYFDITIREDSAAVEGSMDKADLEASFRGRHLKGTVITLPAGYTGCVLKEDRKPYTDEEDRVLRVTHKFSQFKYWNLETTPSENDAMMKAMQWIDIASVLHKTDDDTDNATPDTIR